MKVALISYHKNAFDLYPSSWLERHKKSVLRQTYLNFHIWEMNYGEMEERIFPQSFFIHKPMPTFVHAMNYLLAKLCRLGYDAIGNLNCDDWYSPVRLEKQLPFITQYDLVSSNFALIKDDRITHRHLFDQLDIARELARGHNVIAHPSVIYSRRFLEHMVYEPAEVPREDLLLWQRAINSGFKFKIVPECLLFHRVHENSVCSSENR